METHSLFGKKKFRSEKKFMLTGIWDMKGPITMNYLEKGATVNSAYYCQLLRQYFPFFDEWLYNYILYMLVWKHSFHNC